MSTPTKDTLNRALDACARANRPRQFWLRDDDATAPSAALDRLLEMTRQSRSPVTLAVIPAFAGAELSLRLTGEPLVSVAVHGWSHTNYAVAGEKSQELGRHRPKDQVLAEVGAGLVQLRAQHPVGFVPVLVPPWNRIAPEVEQGLAEAGFAALSVFGPEQAGAVRQINTHVDLIDWRGTRGGKPLAALAAEIAAHLAHPGSAIGVLSHHLVHDAAAWDALSVILETVADHPGGQWVSIKHLMGQPDA